MLSLSLALLLTMLVSSPAIRADEIQERFSAAMEAVEAEQLNTARKLLQELLNDYPTLYRARLELARTNYLARDFDAAEAETVAVLEDPELPPSVRTNLTAFLAQIRDDRRTFEKRHRWNAQLYGGGMYDSNVNFGVARDIVDIGGVQIPVNPLSKEVSDGAAVIDGGVLHSYNPGWRFKAGEKNGFTIWQTQANGYYRSYFDETDFNLGVATIRTGPVWVVPQSWSASIGLQLDQIWLGNERLGLFGTINPTVTWELDPQSQLTASLAFTNRDYRNDEDNGRDGDLWRGNLGYSKVFGLGAVGMQAGVGYADFKANDNRFSYNGPEAYAGLTWNAWRTGSLYSSLNYREFDFEGTDLLFGEARTDDEWRLIAGFRQQLGRTWILRGEWVYTDNKSNLDLFQFDRNQLSLGIQKSW